MLASTLQCIECGAPIRGSAGLGLCAACALRGAINIRDFLDESAGPRGAASPFGDYELLDEVARGGMGIVYRARQRSLNRIVALKVLLGGAFAGEAGKRRLRAEANAVAKLQHTNIVAIYEAGELDGQPFYAMEFIEGRTLAEIVRNGPVPPNHAAKYVVRISEAVHYAHSQGVLHRDLKPSNVIVDAYDEPRVTDFGLAKVFDSTSGETSSASPRPPTDSLTLSGQVLGSPAYMSPEQASGRSREIGTASDVYSLGAILYELLTAHPPFTGETPQAVIEQVKELDPVPPRRLEAGVPADLETVCLKCLEKDVNRRYATAEELANELNRFLSFQPVNARPVGPLGIAWRWAQRHRSLTIALAGILILLLTGLAGATLAALRISRAEKSAVATLREALVEQARGRRLEGGLGARHESWNTLGRAVALGLDGEVRHRARSEAISTLALADIRFVPQPQLPQARAMTYTMIDPSGSCFARMASNNAVILHRVIDGAEYARLNEHVKERPLIGRNPEFSPDGRYLVIFHRDQLTVWDAATGKFCFANSGVTNSFAFGHDGGSVAFRQPDGTMVWRELPSGELLKSLSAGIADPFSPALYSQRMSLSPDGRHLAVVQKSQVVDIIDVETGKLEKRLVTPGKAKLVAWSPGDDWIAVVGEQSRVYFFNPTTGQLEQSYHDSSDGLRSIAFHPREPMFVAASASRTLSFRHLRTGRLVTKAPADAHLITFSPDGTRLGPTWVGGLIGWIEVRPSDCFQEVWLSRSNAPYLNADFSPKGELLAVCNRQRLDVIDSDTFTPLCSLTNRSFFRVRFDSSGFLWTVENGGVNRWRLGLDKKGKATLIRMETRWRGAGWRWLDLSDDGNWIVAANPSKRITRVTTMDGATNDIPFGKYSDARLVAIDREGRFLATGSAGYKRNYIWDLKEKRLVMDIPAGGNMGQADFSPDGRWLATMGEACRLWSVGNWTNSTMLIPPGEAVLGDGIFFADNHWLAVVVGLYEIHLFEVKTRRRAAVFSAPDPAKIESLAVSPNGRWLIAACDEGRLQRWDLQTLRGELGKLGLDW